LRVGDFSLFSEMNDLRLTDKLFANVRFTCRVN